MTLNEMKTGQYFKNFCVADDRVIKQYEMWTLRNLKIPSYLLKVKSCGAKSVYDYNFFQLIILLDLFF